MPTTIRATMASRTTPRGHTHTHTHAHDSTPHHDRRATRRDAIASVRPSSRRRRRRVPRRPRASASSHPSVQSPTDRPTDRPTAGVSRARVRRSSSRDREVFSMYWTYMEGSRFDVYPPPPPRTRARGYTHAPLDRSSRARRSVDPTERFGAPCVGRARVLIRRRRRCAMDRRRRRRECPARDRRRKRCVGETRCDAIRGEGRGAWCARAAVTTDRGATTDRHHRLSPRRRTLDAMRCDETNARARRGATCVVRRARVCAWRDRAWVSVGGGDGATRVETMVMMMMNE